MSRPLRIAFYGYNPRLTSRFLRELAEDNHTIVREYDFRRNRITLDDGTLIVGVVSEMALWDGIRYDQIIICDDRRMEILLDRWDTIARLKQMRAYSDVPEEFGIQYFDVDAPRP